MKITLFNNKNNANECFASTKCKYVLGLLGFVNKL